MAAVVATELPDLAALLELRQRRQWVAWKYVLKNGRQTKPPVNPHTGEGASHSDPGTWGTYEEAMAYAQAYNLPGVGYVLTEDDDLTGVDLDHCRDADFGHLEPWAEEIIHSPRLTPRCPPQAPVCGLSGAAKSIRSVLAQRSFQRGQRGRRVRTGIDERERVVVDEVAVDAPHGERRGDGQDVDSSVARHASPSSPAAPRTASCSTPSSSTERAGGVIEDRDVDP